MTNKVKLLTAFFVLSFAMMMGVTPFSIGGAGVLEASAEETSTTAGDFSVSGGTYGTDYSYDDENGVLTISGNGEYKISMAENKYETSNTIRVTSKNGATITLSDLYISSDSTVPLEITEDVNGDDAKVTIVLEGSNYVYTAADAGLLISTEKEVIITEADNNDTNVLNFEIVQNNSYNGDYRNVGIGSQTNDVNITILGGEIYVNDTSIYSSEITGIGSDEGDVDITISGGYIEVFVYSGYEVTGIGSNEGKADITISGEAEITITTNSGDKITGIGSDTNYAEINISGGDITIEAYGAEELAGIGSDEGDADITISGGTIVVSIEDSSEMVGIGSDEGEAEINISDGTISIYEYNGTKMTAIGTNTPGTEADTYNAETDETETNTPGKATVNISGGTITITSSYGTEIAGIGSDDGDADITISDGTISIDVTNGVEATGIGSDTKTAAVNISGGNITVNLHTTSDDKIAVGIGTDEGLANIYISGGKIEVTVDGTAVYDYAVYTGDDSTSDDTYSVYILPAYSRALDVKYNADSEDTSLYVLKTDIAYKADGTSFYCSVSDGGQVVYEDKNLSVQSTTSEEVDVYVSVYGGQGERFLDEVMLVTEEAYHIVDIDQLLYYEEATLNDDDTEAVVFHAVITDGDNLDKTYYALVRTFDNLDATNLNKNIIYYLSKSLEISA